MVAQITGERRIRKLNRLLERHQTGLEQALTAAQSRNGGTIANGVLEQLAGIRSDLCALFADGHYTAYRRVKIEALLKDQRQKAEAFGAAIKTRSFRQAGTVLTWLQQNGDEIASLI
jgi:hypothetical protein